MADTRDGGGQIPLPILMYEALRELVYADDPGAVGAVGEWLLGRGRELAGFADALSRELSEVDAVYSSQYAAPALMRRLQSAIGEAQVVADALLNNGHTLVAASAAIETARRNVDAARTAPDTDGDGRTETWRTSSPYTDGPTRVARPYVEALNNHLYNLSDNINLLGADLPDIDPTPPPGDDSEGPTAPGRRGAPPIAGPGIGPSGGVTRPGDAPVARPSGAAPGGRPPGGLSPWAPGAGQPPSGSA
ncbi:MAG: hypothetical protein ACRDTM_01550, partial [Micromonosporaceae bacterium]